MADPLGHTTQLQNWLELMRSGDKLARDRLIEYTCGRLRLLTRKMLRGSPKVHRWEETDDVFLAAVTKLHRSLEVVQPESARDFYNLAATQIRRVLIDLARRYYGPEGLGANYESAAMDSDDKVLARYEKVDVEGKPGSLMEWTEFHAKVEELPEEQREVFGVLWYGGLSQKEAVEALGISERTLRRRWRSARVFLYEAMNGARPSD